MEKPTKEKEDMIVDESAYQMLHEARTGSPCLSFDIIKDSFGDLREDYPLSMYLLGGTQAPRSHVNNIIIMKMTDLHKTADKNLCDSESDMNLEEPHMTTISILHEGCVNRIRCINLGNTTLAASWSELGRVHIWNISEQLLALENPYNLSFYMKKSRKDKTVLKPAFTFKGHSSEGYGIDWCPTELGTLASGDCKGSIHIWKLEDSKKTGTWFIDLRPYDSHSPYSVEDLQWSPNERNVLASCSTDKSIKIWDTRVNPQNACMLTAANAHTSDVNVISWNKKESKFVVSGGDDGCVKVWDLRQFNSNSPIAMFKYHSAPVTTVEWSPHEATVFASGGADDQIVQWDLSVETDDINESNNIPINNLPPQLLFIHEGQTDIKELHWHPQCKGTIISTASSGFNIFRTISI